MNRYKYLISDKTDQEIWVCETCKKGNNKLILAGKWKLVDKCSDDGIPCAICDGSDVDAEPRQAAAKKET
jgi:hypothetical protein